MLDDNALLALLKNNRKLRHLSLRQCEDITKDVFVNMPVLNQLVHLDIIGCFIITDSEVETIANCCKNLRHINLKWCFEVTHNGIRLLTNKCVCLTELHVDGSTFEHLINDSDRNEMKGIQSHVHIRKLDLGFYEITKEITDDLLKNIADFCPDIRELHLTGQYKVTDIGVKYVLQKWKDLNFVRILKAEKKGRTIYKAIWIIDTEYRFGVRKNCGCDMFFVYGPDYYVAPKSTSCFLVGIMLFICFLVLSVFMFLSF